jgi:hypothetical protein
MKLRNILITAAAVGFMFASADRVKVVGYSAGDYSDMDTYPHKAAGQNVAYTMGDDFTAVWTDAGTTWGFSKSGAAADNAQLVDMKWSNGSYGLSLGVNMDSGEVGGAAAETTMDIGFGMNLAGWDVGFAMGTADGADMSLNARGALGFWAFDTMTFGFTTGGPTGSETTEIDVNMYGVKDWGAATGMFAMGFENTDALGAVFGGTDAVSLLTTGFSVESTLTDWCDLRIGYDTKFNIAAEVGAEESWDMMYAGLGFNYGSVQLDMIIMDETANNLNPMLSNPLNFLNGRNTALATQWTLSYTW